MFYDRLGGGALLEAAKKRLITPIEEDGEGYDFVLIDSRTGVSDTMGICTIQMPDTLVVCFTLNNQGIEGAADIAGRVLERRQDSATRRFRVIPVAMRAEPGEKDKLDLRLERVKRFFDPFLPTIPVARPDDYWREMTVPYRIFYAYEELLAPFCDRPDTLYPPMLKLAEYLSNQAVTQMVRPPESERLRASAVYAGVRPPAPSEDDTGATADRLARAAEDIWADFPADDQRIVRDIFTRLVRVAAPEEKGGDDVPIPLTLSDLDAPARMLTHELVKRQLLARERDGDSGEEWVRLADSALPGAWPRFREWLWEDRDFLLWRQQLRAEAYNWERYGRDTGALRSDPLLAEAQAWQKKQGDYLSQTDREFIAESVAHEAASTRSARRRRALALSLFALALLLSVGVFRATSQQERARSLVAVADASPDPLESALILTQMGSLPSTPRGLAVARRVAASAIPTLVLKSGMGPNDPGTVRTGNTEVGAATFSPDGARIAVGYGGGSVCLFDARTGRRVATLRGHTGPIRIAIFSPNGTRLGTEAGDKTGRVWDVANKNPPLILDGLNGPAPIFAFSPDGARLATERGRNPQIWDAKTGKPLWKLSGHKNTVLALAFSPDGTRIATASRDYTVLVWDAKTGALRQNMSQHTDEVNSLDFRPDGRRMVTAGDDGRAFVWDLASGAPVVVLGEGPLVHKRAKISGADDNTVPLRSAVFSPGGRFIVTVNEEGVATLYDALSGSRAGEMRGEKGGITGAAFSPDKTSIVCACADGVARMWRIIPAADATATLTRAQDLRGHAGPITRVRFSPNGKMILTASTDGTVRVWPVSPVRRPAANASWSDYLSYLREATRGVCLTVEQRVSLLGETPEIARRAADACVGNQASQASLPPPAR